MQTGLSERRQMWDVSACHCAMLCVLLRRLMLFFPWPPFLAALGPPWLLTPHCFVFSHSLVSRVAHYLSVAD